MSSPVGGFKLEPCSAANANAIVTKSWQLGVAAENYYRLLQKSVDFEPGKPGHMYKTGDPVYVFWMNDDGSPEKVQCVINRMDEYGFYQVQHESHQWFAEACWISPRN